MARTSHKRLTKKQTKVKKSNEKKYSKLNITHAVMRERERERGGEGGET